MLKFSSIFVGADVARRSLPVCRNGWRCSLIHRSVLLSRWCVNGAGESKAMAAKVKTRAIEKSSLINCHLQVVGTGGGEVSPSLLLFTDTQRYLFNCGENMQRLCTEHRLRLSKLQNIFITRLSWENVGGLLGLAMTDRGVANQKIYLHGPEALANLLSAAKFFLGRERISLETPKDCLNDFLLPVYQDENLRIATLELQPTSGSGNSAADEESGGPQPKRSKFTTLSNSTAVFICKLVDIFGRFDPQKAKELGLPPGPKYKRLVNGESVTTPSGRVIQPSEVNGPLQIGPSFIILECPHVGFVHPLTTHPLLQREAFASRGESVSLIVHIAPSDVLEDKEYCRWMASFTSDTKHLILNGTHCPSEVSLRGVMKIQCPLHLMNPTVHHPPPIPEEKTELNRGMKIFQLLSKESIIFGQVLLKYHLRPQHRAGVDTSEVLKSIQEELQERISEIQSNPQVLNAIQHPESVGSAARPPCSDEQEWMEISPETNESPPRHQTSTVPASFMFKPHLRPTLQPDDALITFLGTGASLPSKYRNVSGILLQLPSGGGILLDCGEGTLSQIYRCFGREGGDEVIRNLEVCFISHIHGDHQFGLINILRRRALLTDPKDRQEKIVVIGPRIYNIWLEGYSRTCESVPYHFVNCKEVVGGPATEMPTVSTQTLLMRRHLEFSIQTVPVIHCNQAYGAVVQHSSGWKIVYSGDTRPCPRLAMAGWNATLLLHEATFEDDLAADAEAKKHCTISEALEIAKQMNPDFTILTHFSQRYPKVSPALLNDDCLKAKVAVAFDCMSVHLKELHNLPKFIPAMKEIFAVVLGSEDTSDPVVTINW